MTTDIKTHIQNIRLSQSLTNLMRKKASQIGEFTGITSEEDAVANMKMAKEMADLPKYSEITGSLKSASGVVNFVTNNEFTPLVERILHLAFSPSNNDIYHMGLGMTIPGDYYVDARESFAPIGGSKAQQQEAVTGIENILLGSPVKFNKEFMAANEITDRDMVDVYGQTVWNALSALMDQIANKEREIEGGSIKRKMKSAYNEIVRDAEARTKNVMIRKRNEQNKGKQGYPKDELPVASLEAIEKTKKRFNELRSLYLKQKASAVQTVLAAQADPSIVQLYQQLGSKRAEYSREKQRTNDGFIDWNPSNDLRKINNELSETLMSFSEQQDPTPLRRIIAQFRKSLEEYVTADPHIVQLKERILELLSEDGSKSEDHNFRKNSTEIGRATSEIINRIKNHGSVIIFSNVDNSILVNPSREEESRDAISGINSALERFNTRMEANFVRGKSASTQRKAVVLISKEPIKNLPSNNVVKMGDVPVDAEEAEIIVRNLLESLYERDYIAINYDKSLNDIWNRYQGVTDRNKLAERDRSLYNLEAHIQSKYATEGKPLDDVIKEIESMIIGLGQAQAIGLVKRSLMNAMKISTNEDSGLPDAIDFNSDSWVKSCVTASNELHDENVPGMKSRRAKVAFDDYVFKKTGDAGVSWGTMVGTFGVNKNQYTKLKQVINGLNAKIMSVDKELVNAKTESSKCELQVLKAAYITERDRAVMERSTLLGALPHYIVLYGKPGVGKTVFADALADLFGFPIREINFQETKEKWYGETGRKAVKLLNMVKNSRNTIFLLDELDRDLEMEGEGSVGGGGASGAHSVDKGVTKTLLTTFEEERRHFEKNNVFIIITTNYLGSLDKALLSRAKGNVYKVEAPDDPKDYMDFINSFLRTEKKDSPDAPWLTQLKELGMNLDDYWKSLEDLISSADLQKFCQILADRQLGFRSASGVIRMAVLEHNSYLLSKSQIARGERNTLLGMPFNTDNLCRAASIAKDDDDKNENNLYGVRETSAELLQKANEKLKTGQLKKSPVITVLPPHTYTPEQVAQMIQNKEATMVPSGKFKNLNEIASVFLNDPKTRTPYIDPKTSKPLESKKIAEAEVDVSSGQIVQGFAVPNDIDKQMTWVQPAETAVGEQYEVDEDVIQDPNNPSVTRRVPTLRKPQPQQRPPDTGRPMEELIDGAMQDVSPQVDGGTKPETAKEKQDQSKKEEIKSSTDYYYSQLKKAGLVGNMGQTQQVPVQAVEKQPFDDVEKYGVYFFNKGGIMVAPAGVDEKPQFLY